MSLSSINVAELQQRLRDFADERDWDQFHNPKNLVMALVGEVGELAAVFQWLTPEQSAPPNIKLGDLEAASEEVTDVLFCLVMLADKLNVDLDDAADFKLRMNALKYPVDVSRGSAEKASRRETLTT